MKKCMKSLLGITLAIATLLSVVPIGVFAAAQKPTAIQSNIVAVKDVTLTVPFTSAGEVNTTAKVVKQSGEAVWSFRVDGGNTLAYCVEPGAELGDESTIDSAKANKYWSSLEDSDAFDNIQMGVIRAIAIADYLNPTKDADLQAIHNIVIWEIICGIRDPLTGYNLKVTLQSSFKNAATDDQETYYVNRYKEFVNALKSFTDIPSCMYSSKTKAAANPITLKWSSTNKRYQATVTDTTGLLSSMELPSSFSPAPGATVNVERKSNKLTLWTTTALPNAVTSPRINKDHGFETSETESVLVYGGNLANGDTAQCVVSSSVPDPQAGYFAVTTGDEPTIDITVKKVWEKTTNPPESVTVKLFAGVWQEYTAVLNADNNWSHVFTDLPMYHNGVLEYVWQLSEEPVEGYETTITGSAAEGFVVTNTKITTGTQTISGTKTWADDNNRDGIRPAQIFVNLYRDGKYYAQTTATEDSNWEYSFSEVPIYNDDGSEIVWTIDEVPVPGYTTSYNGFDITNSHTRAVMTLTDAKSWNDDSDRDGIRPDSITIRLYADGEEIAVKTVTEADDWKYEWTDLPKYRDGGIEIQYEIKEDSIEGYDTYYEGWNVINTHEPERIEISGTKTWNDRDNQDGVRPQSITVRLYADGTEIDSVEVTADANGEWNYKFEDLFKYRDHGTEIVYTISEDKVAEYTTTYNGFDITNTHETATTEVKGIKTWVDVDDQDGVRPDSITVRLYRDGVEYDVKTVTAADGWAYKWTGLDKYKYGGFIVEWTIKEDKVDNYTTTYDGYDITNAYTPQMVTVSGAKAWVDANDQDGVRPDSITVRLFRDGVEYDVKTVTEADGWMYEWTGLDRYRDGGEAVVWTVEEDAVPLYTTTYVDGTYDIVNTYHPQTKNISGTKTWVDDNDRDGKRPDSITVRLYRDGVEFDSIVVTEADRWTYEFSELDVYRDHGTEIVWTISEDAVAGYETTYNGYDITNTHETATTDVGGTKTWVDDNDRDGLRPDSVTVRLFADGVEYDHKVVTEADHWSYSWTGLHKYRDGGTEIVWTVDEDAVAGYTKTIDGFNITNTHEIETITISGQKIWNDGSDAAQLRPEAVTLRLYANDVEVATTVVSADTAITPDTWMYEFADLPAYENGKKIRYTVKEDPCENYVCSVMGYDITNTYTPYPDIPQTSDFTNMHALMMVALVSSVLSATGLVLMIRRKRKFERDSLGE